MADKTLQTRSLPSRFPLGALLLVVAALPFVGCGGGGGGSEVNYEDFETLQLRETLVEVPLGVFSVPVPVTTADAQGGVVRGNRMQMKFTLTGLVKPEHKAETVRASERSQGQVRDHVIRICRNSSLDDLLDPELSTLKARLLDAIQPLFDGVMLRRVLVENGVNEPL